MGAQREIFGKGTNFALFPSVVPFLPLSPYAFMTKSPDPTGFDIKTMLDSAVYPHPVDRLELLETHISWIVLTGEYAYKIKKPVQYDFIDYSTRERREHYCRRELALNQRFAPEIYLDVVALCSDPQGLRIQIEEASSTPSQVVEHAVRMRQFPQGDILARRMERDPVPLEWIDRLGTALAEFHASLAGSVLPEGVEWSRVAERDALDNFPMLKEEFGGSRWTKKIEDLETWTRAQIGLLAPRFDERVRNGAHRPCHGDLHLNNIVCWSDQLVPFDGIEFNLQLQWVDVLNDVAFPIMDFVARGYAAHGWRLANRYLEETGLYDQLDLLRFYLVYRALVRAKVTWLNPHNHPDAGRGRPDEPGPWDKYLDAAFAISHPATPRLAITFGLSGSGKSTRAIEWCSEAGAIRIRSDVERQRGDARADYDLESRGRIYGRLRELARAALQARFSVVVDATFLNREHREAFAELAEEEGCGLEILACEAPYEELCRRIRERAASCGDPSEATIAVLDDQIRTHDPLTETERSRTVS